MKKCKIITLAVFTLFTIVLISCSTPEKPPFTPPKVDVPQVPLERKAFFKMKVWDYETLNSLLQRLQEAYSSETLNITDHRQKHGNVEIKVPANKFNFAISMIKDYRHYFILEDITSTDVTKEWLEVTENRADIEKAMGVILEQALVQTEPALRDALVRQSVKSFKNSQDLEIQVRRHIDLIEFPRIVIQWKN